mgnify:CR=1 FL=1
MIHKNIFYIKTGFVVLVLLIGILLPTLYSNDGIDFLSGFLIAAGVLVTLQGIRKLKKT